MSDFMKKDIVAKSLTTQKSGKSMAFQSKMEQAVDMLTALATQFTEQSILVVADSWFGNDGLWRPLSLSAFDFHLLSRLRSNITLYDLPPQRAGKQRGRASKYGKKLGSVTDMAIHYRGLAHDFSVFLYGKQRNILAYERVVMLKNLRQPVRVVWVFRKTRWVAFFTTDLDLPLCQNSCRL